MTNFFEEAIDLVRAARFQALENSGSASSLRWVFNVAFPKQESQGLAELQTQKLAKRNQRALAQHWKRIPHLTHEALVLLDFR